MSELVLTVLMARVGDGSIPDDGVGDAGAVSGASIFAGSSKDDCGNPQKRAKRRRAVSQSSPLKSLTSQRLLPVLRVCFAGGETGSIRVGVSDRAVAAAAVVVAFGDEGAPRQGCIAAGALAAAAWPRRW